MDADEFIRPHADLGQAGNRQRGGVAAEYGGFAKLGFGALGDVGFQRAVLEHCFDDQIAAGNGGVIGGGMDQRQ